MTEITRLLDQHRRAFAGDAWHGPAVHEVLAGVDARRAAAKPIPGAHSIWEIVRHIEAWERIVRLRVEGQSIDATPEEDWPPVSAASEVAWRTDLETLRASHDALSRAISKLTDVDLERSVAGRDVTHYVLLHGQVQHALYHAGQIALLAKF